MTRQMSPGNRASDEKLGKGHPSASCSMFGMTPTQTSASQVPVILANTLRRRQPPQTCQSGIQAHANGRRVRQALQDCRAAEVSHADPEGIIVGPDLPRKKVPRRLTGTARDQNNDVAAIYCCQYYEILDHLHEAQLEERFTVHLRKAS